MNNHRMNGQTKRMEKRNKQYFNVNECKKYIKFALLSVPNIYQISFKANEVTHKNDVKYETMNFLSKCFMNYSI